MQDFTKMRVWQHAHQFRLRIHVLTRTFPGDEKYSLTAQVRRSSASIADNIAESSGYEGNRDSARFIQYSLGSCSETLNHLMAARDLNYITPEAYSSLADAVGPIRGMLVRLLIRMRE